MYLTRNFRITAVNIINLYIYRSLINCAAKFFEKQLNSCSILLVSCIVIYRENLYINILWPVLIWFKTVRKLCCWIELSECSNCRSCFYPPKRSWVRWRVHCRLIGLFTWISSKEVVQEPFLSRMTKERELGSVVKRQTSLQLTTTWPKLFANYSFFFFLPPRFALN